MTPVKIKDKDKIVIGRTPETIPTNHTLRSEAAQEIIGNKPDFMERWSINIFGGILLALLIASAFIKYPEIIDTRVSLTAINSPKEIVTRTSGHLVRLYLQNGGLVRTGEVIGIIENTADHKEALRLSDNLDSALKLMELDRYEDITKFMKRKYSNLGELQSLYKQFVISWQQFDDYMINGFFQRKKKYLGDDIANIDRLDKCIEYQKKFLVEDVALANESFRMNESLYNDKVISKEEFRIEKSRLITKEMAIPQIEQSLINNETNSRGKIKEIDQIEHDLAQQKDLFVQALHTLKTAIDDWKFKYVIQATINGRLSFIIPLQENQFVNGNTMLGYIDPPGSKLYVESYLRQSNFGKIDTGLSVQMRFDAYPYQEFGTVNGKIQFITTTPSDSGFLATISLDRGLVTNNNKQITYKSGLKGDGLIITKDVTLLQRLYYSIIKSTSIGK